MIERFNHPFESHFAVRTHSRRASTLRRCKYFRTVRDQTIRTTAGIERFAKSAALNFVPWGLTKGSAEGTIQPFKESATSLIPQGSSD